MTHNEKDGWDNPLSYIQTTIQMRQEDNLLRVHYRGFFWYNGVCFKFYVCQNLPSLSGNRKPTMKTIESDAVGSGQLPPKDLGCRGELSIIDPESGYSMELTGSSKKQRIKKSKQISSKRSGLPADAVEKQVDVTVRKNILTKENDFDLIKNTIEKVAKKAYAEQEVTLVRKLGRSITRDTITATQAYNLYCTKFFDEKYFAKKKPTSKTLEQYKSALKTLCYALPTNISMGAVRNSQVIKLFKGLHPSDFEKGLLRSFWDFCRKNGYCKNADPFSDSTRKKKYTADTLQQNSVTPESLTLADCNKVYHWCMDHVQYTGMTCAVALTLFGGFSTDESLKKKWGDVIFSADNPYDVCIQHRNDAAAGATHDRTRPLLIQGARILTKRYHHLLTIYSAEDLSDMPIVTDKGKKYTPMNSKLTQYYETVLRQSEIATGEYSVIKEGREAVSKRLFRNTYAHLVDYECGLQKEFGMREYLKGNSLTKNTSADHYIGYSSEDGLLAMAELLRRIGPEEKSEKSCLQKVNNNDGVTYICSPVTTTRKSSLHAEVIVPPGATISIHAPHGVDGSLVCESASQMAQGREQSPEGDDALPGVISNQVQGSAAIGKENRPSKKQRTQPRKRSANLKKHTAPVTGSTEIQHDDLSCEGEQLSLF